MRVGFGYDVHAFAPGRKLILGGVDVPHVVGLSGHSDADVLIHAIMDAILGAAGLGDIGRYFPPSDPVYKDACSLDLLRRVCEIVAANGFVVVNVDSTVNAESPRLAPHVQEMRERLSGVMGVPAGSVNVKATTSEGLGYVGREEGMVAYAVALIEERT